ncbi:hypothetical protein OAR19_00215 [bacterium]|nr:hypothetical protein [bacterium]
MSENQILKFDWRARPTLHEQDRRVPVANLEKVDAFNLLQPLLGNKLLDGSLRVVDVLNGCRHHCDTCYADSIFPTKIFTLDSWVRLSSENRYIRMLQGNSYRKGSIGDVLNHPQGIEIIKVSLETTEEKHKQYPLKIFTNYRKNMDSKIDSLIDMAIAYPERIILNISLPLNKNSVVNRQFVQYVMNRREIFRQDYSLDNNGLIEYISETNFPNIFVHDVSRPRPYYKFKEDPSPLDMTGRRLVDELIPASVDTSGSIMGNEEYLFAYRGLVKLYFNPDGLWLVVYTTAYESYTTKIFTLVTPENVSLFSNLSFHFEFPQPPNWNSAFTRRMSLEEARELKYVKDYGRKKMKQGRIVRK